MLVVKVRMVVKHCFLLLATRSPRTIFLLLTFHCFFMCKSPFLALSLGSSTDLSFQLCLFFLCCFVVFFGYKLAKQVKVEEVSR